MEKILHIKSVTEAMDFMSSPKPKHPLIAIFRHEPGTIMDYTGIRFTADLYMISLKDKIEGAFGYGRNSYDFHEGTMIFLAPGQVVTPGNVEVNENSIGWNILFHPDLIHGSNLGDCMDKYAFFDYELNEALHLSEEEKRTLTELVQKIENEVNNTIDKHSQKLIITNLELILDYCFRYYDRQFYTRSNLNKGIVSKFNELLKDYFNTEKQLESGIPSVQYCGEQLSMSPNYLSDLLKKETDKSAQDHIHYYVIEKAKHILLSSQESVSQVAYTLGFNYSQHFSKLFKQKTGMSPSEYRNLN